MSLELFLIGILLFLLLASHVYWPIVFFKFLDRYMSRDFTEYAQGKRIAGTKPEASLQSPPEDESDPHAQEQAEALNAILGIQ
jgi:biopolymer transport protein ExbB/TolQ